MHAYVNVCLTALIKAKESISLSGGERGRDSNGINMGSLSEEKVKKCYVAMSTKNIFGN